MKRPRKQVKESGTHQTDSEDVPSTDSLPSDRFPTRQELNAFLGDQVSTVIDMELAMMAYERHLMRIARHDVGGLSSAQSVLTRQWYLSPLGLHSLPLPSDLVVGNPIAALGLVPPPSQVFPALRNRRVNQRTMGIVADLEGLTPQDRFNRALRKAHKAGTYQKLAAIHANAETHRMHSMQGVVGTERFLPWHRLYVLQMEKLLQTYEPSIQIPYWDFANDHARPDWVFKPSEVDRPQPGGGFSLPVTKTVDSIVLTNASYTAFSLDLELDAHNDVHNWCGGTLKASKTASLDPIFWLLHANVDRIWDRWQLTHNGIPSLNGQDAILDPWGPLTAANVDSILLLGYSYSG